jgi:hypothetical protein
MDWNVRMQELDSTMAMLQGFGGSAKLASLDTFMGIFQMCVLTLPPPPPAPGEARSLLQTSEGNRKSQDRLEMLKMQPEEVRLKALSCLGELLSISFGTSHTNSLSSSRVGLHHISKAGDWVDRLDDSWAHIVASVDTMARIKFPLQVLLDFSLQPHLRVPLGHLVAVLLDLITQSEKDRAVQIQAIRVLCMAVDLLLVSDLYAEKGSNANTSKGRSADSRLGARKTLCHFLPGISSALAKALKQGTNKMGQPFSASAMSGMLVAWVKVVAIALGICATGRPDEMNTASGNRVHSDPTPASPLERLRQLAEQRLQQGAPPQIEVLEKEKPQEGSLSKESLLVDSGMGPSSAWWDVTCEKLSMLIDGVLPTTIAHPSWAVRKATLAFVATVFQRCGRSLDGCRRTMLEVVLSSLSDPFEEVQQAGRVALKVFQAQSHIQRGDTHLTWMSGLDTRFVEILTSLGKDSKVNVLSVELLASLRLARGYALLFRGQEENSDFNRWQRVDGIGAHRPAHQQQSKTPVNRWIQLVSHAQYIVKSLAELMQPDVSSPSTSMAVVVDKKGQVSPDELFHKRSFKFLYDDEVEREAKQMINCVGSIGDAMLLHALLDELFQILSNPQTPPELRAGASTVLLEFVRGGHHCFPDNFPYMIDHILSSDLWNHFPEDALSVEVLRSNECTVAVFIECISSMCELCPTSFEGLLMRVLFPLLEKSGDTHKRISRAAIACLHRLAKNHTHSNVVDCEQSERLQQMLSDNMDYLIDTVVARLSYLQQYPNTPLVLSALLKLAGVNALPLLRDGIWAVLQSLDANSGDMFRAMELLKVTQAMVQSCGPLLLSNLPAAEHATGQSAEFAGTSDKINLATSSSLVHLSEDLMKFQQSELFESTLLNPLTTFEEVRYTFLHQDYMADMLSLGKDEDGSASAENAAIEDSSDMDGSGLAVKHGADPGDHNKMLLGIITRCSHFISSPDLKLRVLALDCCGQCLEILKETNAEAKTNDLLPNIHLMWPALMSSLHRHSFEGQTKQKSSRYVPAEDDENSAETLALMASLNLITVVCKVAGGFVARRFASVWDVLRRHLRRTRRLLQKDDRDEFELAERMPTSIAGGTKGTLTMRDLRSITVGRTEHGFAANANEDPPAVPRKKTKKKKRAWTSITVRLRASIFKALVLVSRSDGGKSALAGDVAKELSVEAYWHLWRGRGMKLRELDHSCINIATQHDVVSLAFELYKELLLVDPNALWLQTCVLANWQVPPPPSQCFSAVRITPRRKARDDEGAFLPWMESESDIEEVFEDKGDLYNSTNAQIAHKKNAGEINGEENVSRSLLVFMDSIRV